MQTKPIKDLKLVHCPICAQQGEKVVLGGIDERGNFVVKRYLTTYTKVHSDNYRVECSGCNEIIFIHKK